MYLLKSISKMINKQRCFVHRYKPISWYQVNDTAWAAICFFQLGPSLHPKEPILIDDYYEACSNALVFAYGMVHGIQCSFTDQLRYYAWNYACSILSTYYEMHRVPEARGQFGPYMLTALLGAMT